MLKRATSKRAPEGETLRSPMHTRLPPFFQLGPAENCSVNLGGFLEWKRFRLPGLEPQRIYTSVSADLSEPGIIRARSGFWHIRLGAFRRSGCFWQHKVFGQSNFKTIWLLEISCARGVDRRL